jgi:transcriptional accessory protein Tex/SPT6
VLEERPIPDPADVPLEQIDVSNPFMFRQGMWYPYFARLRKEAGRSLAAEPISALFEMVESARSMAEGAAID